MGLAEIYRPIRSELKATETFLSKQLASSDGLLGTMTRYVAKMPGKRIRPALALLGALLVNKSRNGSASSRRSDSLKSKAVQLAAAVEMIHTATLLHDDVIDGAELRRGFSTINAKWGDTLSVLSGDYLYSQAFCLLSGLNHPAVLNLMSDTARIVCEGEVAQIQHQYNLNLSRAEYIKIIQWKTASLMGGSTQAGALLAGATEMQAQRLGSFGLNFGVAFQILDDTQDLVGDQAILGKSLGTDLTLGNMTLPFLYLRESGDPKISKRLATWFNGNGHSPEQRTDAARFLREYAIQQQIPSACRREAGRYIAKARAALAPFPTSLYKSSLLALTDFLLQ